jgi:hypothetical protein
MGTNPHFIRSRLYLLADHLRSTRQSPSQNPRVHYSHKGEISGSTGPFGTISRSGVPVGVRQSSVGDAALLIQLGLRLQRLLPSFAEVIEDSFCVAEILP